METELMHIFLLSDNISINSGMKKMNSQCTFNTFNI